MEQVNRFKSPTSEGTILLSQITAERQRMAKLQAEVDEKGEMLIKSIHGHSVAQTYDLRNTYDQNWFKSCLYSSSIKRKIAQALLDATRNNAAMIDTTVWKKVIEGHS